MSYLSRYAPFAAFLLSATALAGCNDAANVPPTCDDLSCAATTCAELACADANRTCTEGDETTSAVCGECFSGFTLEGSTCVDIDECDDPANGCHPTEICVNAPGDYECLCDDGFQRDGDGCAVIVTQAAMGRDHVCAIANGALYCWGRNQRGQLGVGDIENRDRPVRVGTRSDWESVSAAGYHTCAIAQGELYCWGYNNYGQLGLSGTTRQLEPVRIGNAHRWRAVATGTEHTCAISNSGIFCWGSNSYGQLGIGEPTVSQSSDLNFVDNEFAWETIEAGNLTTCAIAENNLYCWGENIYSQVNANPTNKVHRPHLRSGERVWVHVTVGDGHICAIAEQQLYCWGRNNEGQLGNGTFDSSNWPQAVMIASMGKTWTTAASGAYHTCGITNEKLYCWGENGVGELGTGTTPHVNQNAPLPVDSEKSWNKVFASTYATCGISEGRLYCWGSGDYGKLGQGNSNHSSVPTRVYFP